MGPELRRLLFAGLLAAMVAALTWAFLTRERHPPPNRVPIASPAVRRHPSGAVPPAAAQAARRFLNAFLAYEVGDGGPEARRSLRADASAAFARSLLDAPHGASVSRHSAAHLLALGLHRLPGHPDLVLVSGTALRPSGPEPLAFLIARRRGRWLAVAPAQ